MNNNRVKNNNNWLIIDLDITSTLYQLLGETGRIPTIKEIATVTGCNLKTVRNHFKYKQKSDFILDFNNFWPSVKQSYLLNRAKNNIDIT